jgi:phospholipid/cholesterol/gamma-HCH transport system substrate-binding protein
MSRSTARGRTLAAVAGAVAAATLVTGCQFQDVYDLPLPGGKAGGGDAYRVTLEFPEVLDLVPKSSVRVNDVSVGEVEDVWLDGFIAKVRIRVLDSVTLPDNAVARLRQTSLLGEKFIELAPPTGATPQGRLSDGDLIPISRTSRNIEIEEVLGALSLLLNGGGVAQLKTITVELNKVMEGREDRIRGLLADLETFIGGLDDQKADIVRALEGIDRLSRTLVAQRSTINQALDQIGPGLEVLTDQRKLLVQMLQALAELGEVGARVVRQSKDDTVADLRLLLPTLTKFAEAGANLPKSLETLVSFPFSDASVEIIKGDWSNLHAKLRVDLAEILGNVTDDPNSGEPAPNPLSLIPGLRLPGSDGPLDDPLGNLPGGSSRQSSPSGLGDLLIGGLR